MPRLARLLTQWQKKEIIHLFKTAKRILVHAGLDIRLAPRSNPEYSRILIVISKKVGNSPVRNLLRRRVKALFYEMQLYQQAYDWLIITRPGAGQIPFTELKEIIAKVALQQPGLHSK